MSFVVFAALLYALFTGRSPRNQDDTRSSQCIDWLAKYGWTAIWRLEAVDSCRYCLAATKNTSGRCIAGECADEGHTRYTFSVGRSGRWGCPQRARLSVSDGLRRLLVGTCAIYSCPWRFHHRCRICIEFVGYGERADAYDGPD